MIKKDIRLVHGVKKEIGLSSRATRARGLPIEGGEVRLLNDDEVLGTIKNPEDVLHHI